MGEGLGREAIALFGILVDRGGKCPSEDSVFLRMKYPPKAVLNRAVYAMT